VPEGIAAAELARALRRLGSRADLVGVELAEYLPRLDPDGRSARVAIELLLAALCGTRQNPQVVA
jgi:arginase family enzyme